MVELLLNEVAENFVAKHRLEVSQSDCNQDPAPSSVHVDHVDHVATIWL
jgi:hypothetical protein